MDKKLVQNYIYSSLYQLLLVLMPFITIPYLTSRMGSEILSINSWTANIVQWFVLFGILGVNTYGNREIARVKDDKSMLSKTFFEIYFMQLICMVISTLLFLSYAYFGGNVYSSILIIQGITLLSVALDITWFFYGVEDFKKASIRNMAVKIVGVILIFTFIKDGGDLVKFVLINTLVGVVGQLIMWIQLRSYVSFTKVSLKNILRHLKPNLALFIPQIAISVYSVLDITMLGALYDKIDHVSFYETSQKFVKMFLFFITAIGSVMLPRVSNLFVNGEIETINKTIKKTFRFALYLSIPMIFGIFGMIQTFVDWFLQPDYQCVGDMIKMTSPIILFIALSNVYGTQYMIPVGMHKKYSISVVCGAVINFLINYTLMPTYGAYGAIVGSVCAEMFVTIIQYFFIRKSLVMQVKISELFKIVFCSFLMYLPVSFIGRVLEPSIAVNLIQVATGIIVYFGALYVLKDAFFTELVQLVRNRGNKDEV